MYTNLNLIKYYSEENNVKIKKCLEITQKSKPDSEILPILFILENLGMEDALWCLCAVKGYHEELRRFACNCFLDTSLLWSFPETTLNYLKNPVNRLEITEENKSTRELAAEAYKNNVDNIRWYEKWPVRSCGFSASNDGFAAWRSATDVASTAADVAEDAVVSMMWEKLGDTDITQTIRDDVNDRGKDAWYSTYNEIMLEQEKKLRSLLARSTAGSFTSGEYKPPNVAYSLPVKKKGSSYLYDERFIVTRCESLQPSWQYISEEKPFIGLFLGIKVTDYFSQEEDAKKALAEYATRNIAPFQMSKTQRNALRKNKIYSSRIRRY